MRTERTGTEVRNALFEVRLDGTCAAPAEAVYGLLVDLEQHLEWGGRSQKRKKFRLSSMEAPSGPASVGTEFRTTGIDPSGSFTDTSVVTEAIPPEVFEFVTEARLRRRRGDVVEWTIVHRYEIEQHGVGCGVSYSLRVMRLSRPLWCTRRWAKGLAQKISASYTRRGFQNLLQMAEERAGANAVG